MKASRERVTKMAGKGCFIQALGLLAPFLLGSVFGGFGVAVGAVLLVWLFVVGSMQSRTWRCGHCKNPLVDKDIRVCPVCKADLGD